MKKFTVQEALTFGWNTYKKNWRFFLVLLLIVWGACTILGAVSGLISNSSMILGLIVKLAVWVAQVILGIGLIKISLDAATHKKLDYHDLYTHYSLFWKYLGGSILYGLVVLGGLILFVIPGIYWAIKYNFIPYLIIDHKLGPIEAFKKSGQMTKGVKMELLLLMIAVLVLNVVGALLFMVGLIVTAPISMIALAHVYEKLK